ncbi:MAG: PorV/PorQ family protein [Candidatus Cloacimonadota bacterium]|nr:PorV/PorQ family protein [Candidatus Cloacimonadota bacterium]
MRKLIIITLLLVFSLGIYAEVSGESGFQMLKITTGTVQAAMAGTSAGLVKDAFSYTENAALGMLKPSRTISVSQNYWIFETSMNSLSYQYSTPKTSFAIGYRYLDYGKIESRDDIGTIIGEFHPMDLNLMMNIGRRILPNHYVGINIFGLYEKIDNSSSLGASFDLGYYYLTPLRYLKLAAAVKHLGFTGKMDEERIDLPETFEFSAVIDDISLLQDDVNLNQEIKLYKETDDDELKVAWGTNVNIYELIDLRLGYKFNHDSQNFSGGFGIVLHNFSLDYAFLPFADEIKDVHMFGLSYHF